MQQIIWCHRLNKSNFPSFITSKENSVFGLRADTKELENFNSSIKVPAPDIDGRVNTLNKTGFMFNKLDPISERFITDTINSKFPILEIGSAYGVVSQKALINKSIVVANDIDMRHLLLLRNQVDVKYWSSLYLNNQKFPEETDFSENLFSNIIFCRVAHFLDPDAMELGLNKIHKWLIPGGKLYFVVITPYHRRFKWFLSTYNKRWKDGVEWPGEIKECANIWPQELSNYIPDYLHLMDERPFERAVKKIGFKILEMSLFQWKIFDNLVKDDSKDYLGAILRKQ